MKKHLRTFIFSMLALLFTSMASDASASNVYAQLSSREDQVTTMDNINQGIVAIMQNVDGIQGLSYDPKKSEITVNEDGTYFILAGVQMGAREAASQIIKGGDLYFWMESNDKAIDNSGSWIFASPSARAHSVSDQAILACKKGDRIRFKFAASSPSMGLLTFTSTEKWPASPGITVSMYKIN